MLTLTFQKKFQELRESIFRGNVSDGVTQLGLWLTETSDKEELMEILLEIALLSIVCGDMEEAESRWSEAKLRASWLSPEEAQNSESVARLNAYSAYFKVAHGQKKSGFARLEDCLLASPDDFELYLLRGIAYSQQGMYEHAQADLDRANTLCPDNVLIMSTMADICVELGERDRAISLHETVLEASPDFRRSLMSLGVLYFDMDRPDDAFRLFQCLVAYDPLNWFAWTCLGDIRLMQVGRTFQALPYYAAAIVSGTEDSLVYYNLVRGLFLLGRFDQGIRLMKQFSAQGLGWDNQIRESVSYLRLIGEVLTTTNYLKSSEFASRFRKLSPYNDEANKLLFYLLNMAASLTYRENIQEIFGCHLAMFVYTAKYISLCEGRVIQPEETTMLGVLTHMMIWHGLMIESRALINLLDKAEEPRVIDMNDRLRNEFQRHAIVARQSGVDLELFHEKLIRYPGAEEFLNFIMLGQPDRVPVKTPWKSYLVEALSNNDLSDLSRACFEYPGDSVIEAFEAAISHLEAGDSDLTRLKMWSGLRDYLGNASAKDVKCVDGLEQSELCWQSLGRVFDKQEASARENKQLQDGFVSLLRALATRKSELESDEGIAPANDNTIQVCAAQPKEALSGFDPLPFAIDGTAFKKWMVQAEDQSSVLDENAFEDFWTKWAASYLFSARRDASYGSVLSEEDPGEARKEVSVFADRLRQFWKMLRGGAPVQALPEVGRDSLFGSAFDYALQSHPSAASVFKLISELPDRSFQLPEIKRFSVPVLFTHPSFPAKPQAASLYARPIANNLLGQVDLCEQFFNYAVSCVERFIESPKRDVSHLKAFVGDDLFTFYAPELKNNGLLDEKSVSLRQSPEDIIQTAEALGESLSVFYSKQLSRDYYRNLGYRNILDGCGCHPFLRQFKAWAEAHAKALWPTVAEVEAQARDIRDGSHYVVIWRLHDLLARYPYLSRLYLMLAGVYASLDMPEKVFKTLQAGLSWEERLYAQCGWQPIHPDESHQESALEIVEAGTELEEPQPLLWPERYVFQPRDEAMYHYSEMNSGYRMRRIRLPRIHEPLFRIVFNDKAGAYDFYRLFRKFLMRVPQLCDVFMQALAEPGVYTLRDYLVYAITNLVSPECFPLRRELAEMLCALYPDENPGALGRFYCDNLQPANALPLAAYAYYAETIDDETDDLTQSSVTLGCLLYDMGYMSESMCFLEHAVKVKNPSPMAFLTIGCALIELRKFDEAIRYLNAGLKLDPSSDRFYYNMALAYIELDELEAAEKAIKTGISLSSYPVDLNMQLMRVYVMKGLYVEALPLARYVASEDPEMFVNAINLAVFKEFTELPAVQAILSECSYGGHS